VNAFFLKENAGTKNSIKKKGSVKHLDHAALTKRRHSKSLKTYSTKKAYTDGQYLNHPKFGEGYILGVSSPPSKMEVLFADRKRVLVCGPGSANGAPKAQPFEISSKSSNKKVEIDKPVYTGWGSLGFLHSKSEPYTNSVNEEFVG
jgi:hypothetical protein